MLRLPQSPDEFVKHLRSLHEKRKQFPRPQRRLSLTLQQRADVLDKTDSRCHLCGGAITENKFAADHVLSHAAGGEHKLANYLAAHGLCNGCRWFYSPEEFQWILRMGVWARKQIEDQKTTIRKDMLPVFWKHESKLPERRRNACEEETKQPVPQCLESER
jgi:hypothetical protein